jgi:group I intron endonuclease
MIIYKATSITTGKSYIGQTWRTFKARKAEHFRGAANVKDVKVPTIFNLAMSQLGTADFEWEILETCDSAQHCNEREKFYIKLLNTLAPNGYNATTGGTGMDNTMSEAVRNKIASTMVLLHADPEYQAKMYPKLKGLMPPNKGVPMTEQQKAKVSAARKAIYLDPTYVNPNVGQKRTGKALKNVQEGHAKRVLPKGDEWTKAHGNQYTEEVREKMRQAKLGKKPTNTQQVQCIETGEIFAGLTEAAEKMNLPRQSIWMNIKGKVKKVGKKYTFRYTGNI